MGRLNDLGITALSLGGAPLGNMFDVVSDRAAHATVDAAWESGIRYFDTAPLYGHGLSESRIGGALRHRPRGEFVLSTKVGRVLMPGRRSPTIFTDVPDLEPVFDFSADGVRRSLDASLERLGLDRVDVVLVHDPDHHEEAALAGAFPALLRLRDEGAVRAIGVGMNQAEMPARFVERVDLDCVLLAGRYSLLDHRARTTLLDRCADRGVDVIAAGVFNSGLLADPDAPGATYDYVAAPADLVTRARRIAEVCGRHEIPLRAAALQFPAGHRAVCTVLVGARSAAEIRENAQHATRELPAELWDDLRAEGLIDPDAPTPAPPSSK